MRLFTLTRHCGIASMSACRVRISTGGKKKFDGDVRVNFHYFFNYSITRNFMIHGGDVLGSFPRILTHYLLYLFFSIYLFFLNYLTLNFSKFMGSEIKVNLEEEIVD